MVSLSFERLLHTFDTEKFVVMSSGSENQDCAIAACDANECLVLFELASSSSSLERVKLRSHATFQAA